MRLNQIYREFEDRVQFYCIYIREAHAVEEWQALGNIWEEIEIAQHETADERAEAAGVCVLKLDLEMPMLLDDMSNEVDRKYAALPERLFVLDPDGVVTYRSEMGPFGFKPEEWRLAIVDRLAG